MNTRDIRFLLKIYECESITLAAEQLYITPQGLSNILGKIESEVGAELFVRNRGGTYPTEYGKAFRPHAVKMLDHYEDGLKEIRRIRDEQEGTVRIGYAFGALNRLATDFPMEFQERHQQYKLDYMELPDAVVESFVERGDLDIGFTACPDFGKFDAELMEEAHILFVTHDQSRFYGRESVEVAEICDEPLTLRNDNFATTRIIMREFEKNGKTPSVLLRTGGIIRSLVFCTEHRANTLILDFLTEDFKYDNLRAVPFKEDLKWPLYMITRKGRPLGRAALTFIDEISRN